MYRLRSLIHAGQAVLLQGNTDVTTERALDTSVLSESVAAFTTQPVTAVQSQTLSIVCTSHTLSHLIRQGIQTNLCRHPYIQDSR